MPGAGWRGCGFKTGNSVVYSESGELGLGGQIWGRGGVMMVWNSLKLGFRGLD